MSRCLHNAVIVVLLLCVSVAASAQRKVADKAKPKYMGQQYTSNFTATLGIGGATLAMSDGFRPGIGANIGVGYVYHWRYDAGIHTGLGIRYAHSAFESGNIEAVSVGKMTAYNNTSSATRTTHYLSTITTVREDYDALFLDIPLQIIRQKGRFYYEYGFRVVLPLSVTAAYDYGETIVGAGLDIDGFGTYIQHPMEVDRIKPQHEQYTVGTLKGRGMAYPAYLALTVSGGYCLTLKSKQTLHIGVYADIALNRTCVGGTGDLLSLDNDKSRFRPVLQSNLASSLRYASVGIKVDYNLAFGKLIETGPKRHKGVADHKYILLRW